MPISRYRERERQWSVTFPIVIFVSCIVKIVVIFQLVVKEFIKIFKKRKIEHLLSIIQKFKGIQDHALINADLIYLSRLVVCSIVSIRKSLVVPLSSLLVLELTKNVFEFVQINSAIFVDIDKFHELVDLRHRKLGVHTMHYSSNVFHT